MYIFMCICTAAHVLPSGCAALLRSVWPAHSCEPGWNSEEHSLCGCCRPQPYPLWFHCQCLVILIRAFLLIWISVGGFVIEKAVFTFLSHSLEEQRRNHTKSLKANQRFFFFFWMCLNLLLMTSSSINLKSKNKFPGVSIVAQWKRIRLASTRTKVRSLASLSGLRIRCCREPWYSSKMWLGSGVAVA